jgi:hypothetical protein
VLVETNWSREGAARSFGFRNVPLPAAPKDSRDGDVLTELERGTGSFDDVGAGSLEVNRGMPVGFFWRDSESSISG